MSKKSDHVMQITAVLARHSQRATYGAVGGLVGLPAQSVMAGLPKNAQNSWIVSKTTGMPTGYSANEIDPHLLDNEYVITAWGKLEVWLHSHR